LDYIAYSRTILCTPPRVIQLESTSNKSATVLADLEDSHGATDLREINIEDLDFNIDGGGFEYASTDTPTIDVQLEAAPEVSHQLSHLKLTDFARTRPLPGFSTSIPYFFIVQSMHFSTCMLLENACKYFARRRHK